MKHKKLLIVLAVVVVMAVAATAAYAWWTAEESVTNNTVSVATAGDFVLEGGPVSATGLIPSADPAPNETTGDPPLATDTEYPSSTYFALKNDADYPMKFYAYLSDGAGNLDPAMVGVRIYLNPPTSAPGYPGSWGPGDFNGGPDGFVVFQGHLSDLWGQAQGRYYLSSSTEANFGGTITPIYPDQWAVYRICVWLDGNVADNSASGKSLSCTLNFKGSQLDDPTL
jgi:predicted ribosomally synthesized peptide with SipW-like signal peptide